MNTFTSFNDSFQQIKNSHIFFPNENSQLSYQPTQTGPKTPTNSYPLHENINFQNTSHQIYDMQYSDIDSYEKVLKLCHGYRKENSKLKMQVQQLQNTVKILQIKAVGGQGVGVKGMKYQEKQVYALEREFQQYKSHVYKQYIENVKNMYKIIEYLYICFCESQQNNNFKSIKPVMDRIKQLGIQKFITKCMKKQGDDVIKQLIQVCQHWKSPNEEDFEFGSEFDQRQSKIIRQKLKQISQINQVLLNLYKNQLLIIKTEAKGQSKQIVKQLKQTILKTVKKLKSPNFNSFDKQNQQKNENKVEPKQNHSNNMNFGFNYTLNGFQNKDVKIEVPIKLKEKSSVKKRMSLGCITEVLQRPPLPFPMKSAMNTRKQRFSIKNMLSQTPKSIGKPSQTPTNKTRKNSITNSHSKSKAKKQK